MNTKSRRHFVQNMGGMMGAIGITPFFSSDWFNSLDAALAPFDALTPEEAAKDEDFWFYIQRAFNPSPLFINLENGYFCPQPVEVMQAQFANIKTLNERSSFYMRRERKAELDSIQVQIAELAGCSTEEIIITRNTTEALDTVIAGIDFKEGDEAIMCHVDYDDMLQALDQQARRVGLVNKFIELPLHPQSDDEIVSLYENAITPQTRVILVTHVSNITGQVLPVRKICDMAHRHNVEVICDSAHAFAHLDFKISDLNCDYFGASLHKWLCTPLGAGILYIKKEKISNVWPLYGDATYAADDIQKFSRSGTHPVSTFVTIADALRFHNMIGAKRKEARLRYLKQYWTEKVRDLPGMNVYTPWEMERSSALSLISVDGLSPDELVDRLYDEFRIFTVTRINPAVNGVRITPHLYTRIEELDKLVHALTVICS